MTSHRAEHFTCVMPSNQADTWFHYKHRETQGQVACQGHSWCGAAVIQRQVSLTLSLSSYPLDRTVSHSHDFLASKVF